MLDLHTLAIVGHALSATGAFIVSIALLVQSKTLRQLQLARAVLVLLVLMEVFLVIAIISHFNSLPTIKQLIFGGLAILLLYIIWPAVQAVSVLREQPGNQVAVMVAQAGRLLCVSFDRTRMLYCKAGNRWASILETPGNT